MEHLAGHLVCWSAFFDDQLRLENFLEDQGKYEQPEKTRSNQEQRLEQYQDPALVVLDVSHLISLWVISVELSLFLLISYLHVSDLSTSVICVFSRDVSLSDAKLVQLKQIDSCCYVKYIMHIMFL